MFIPASDISQHFSIELLHPKGTAGSLRDAKQRFVWPGKPE